MSRTQMNGAQSLLSSDSEQGRTDHGVLQWGKGSSVEEKVIIQSGEVNFLDRDTPQLFLQDEGTHGER